MKRNKFNLSYHQLATMEMGKLVPVGLTEVLPGDTFDHQTSALIRLSPQLAPVMHPVDVRIHHFYVPHRLVWGAFEDYITGGPDGNNDADFVNGVMDDTELMDYYGVPPVTGLQITTAANRGYNEIWNEFYRDQDLQEERGQAVRTVADIAWEKDYFTASRPWTQKGDDVTIPVGSQAPIKGFGVQDGAYTDPNVAVRETGGIDREYDVGFDLSRGTNPAYAEEDPDNPGYPAMYADLSAAGAVDINDFRLAFALQRYKEARSRYGSRFTEYLRYLGVKSSDSRLQRPEYLGGGKQTISFSEVLQTASDDIGQEQTPVGTLRGHGIAALRSNRYRRFFEEHGYVHTLMSVRPRTIYSNGADRHFFYKKKEDMWQKELQHVGQQEVRAGEVYAQAGDEVNQETFGYTDRYRQYRESRSKVTGEFRTILDYWHMARKFDSLPTLNEDFIKCDATKRIYAEQEQHPLYVMVNHNLRARRLVSRNAGGRIV